ncbi:transporter substrate-binding domain-containing protein [Vibrio sp. Isolate23]|uniref:substrate-binding periplasmic protein n=1 Tax=Vibrio sp. Isolate23 TaxID=2908533 RepID=UPI001EFD11A6|nr:transporter substrate-binding domain-containing protein [Vibrio sp. Isolate23]MCG9681278.1 transporter substrate-binding domain-containing protein [Vibrio sp. Isolate23]
MKRIISLQSLIIAWSIFFSSVSVSGSTDDLRELSYFTESYPPANYIENDQITGYAVEILRAASKMVGEEVELSQVTLQPWARSYRTVLTRDDSVLFSTTRSEHREPLFHWVGPIAEIQIVVMARKDAGITIDKPMDMANYRIGVIRDDIGEQTLLAMGLPRNSMQEANYVTTLAEQLMKKRIDLFVYAHRAAIWWAKQANVDPDLFESVYVVREGQVYFAFNVDVKPEVIAKLQKGMDMLKSTKGESGQSLYREIMEKYE